MSVDASQGGGSKAGGGIPAFIVTLLLGVIVCYILLCGVISIADSLRCTSCGSANLSRLNFGNARSGQGTCGPGLIYVDELRRCIAPAD